MVDPPLVSSKYIPQKNFLSNAAGKSYISLICPHSIFGNLPDLLVPDIRLFGPRKLVGAKHNLVLVEWTEISLFDEFVEALIFKITEGKKNFSANSRLHCLRRLAGTITNNFCFRSAHFCESRSPSSMFYPDQLHPQELHPSRMDYEKRRIYLMRVQIHLSIRQHRCELLNTVRRVTTGQFVRVK